MAEFPYIKLYTDAYLGDTQHLTLEEHGAYLKLLMIAWRSPDCALPDDDKRIATMLGITSKKWASLKSTIIEFFSLREGKWTQKKLTEVRREVEDSRAQKVAAGEASAEAKRLKNKETTSTDVITGDQREGQRNANGNGNNTKDHIPEDSPNGESVVAVADAPPPAKQTRGTRWQGDVPEDWRAWARTERSDLNVELVAEKFRDHFVAKPGQAGVKLDWLATWRNWIRNESKGYGNAGRNEPASVMRAIGRA